MLKIKVLFICFIFAIICALTKQLYDKNALGGDTIFKICLSTVTGIIVSLIGIEYVGNYYLLVGLSGLSGLFGSSTIRIVTRFLLGQKVIRIQITDDDEPIEITYNRRRAEDEIIDGMIDITDEEEEKNKT